MHTQSDCNLNHCQGILDSELLRLKSLPRPRILGSDLLKFKRSIFAYIDSSESESSLNILSHPEGHPLRHTKTLSLLKTDVVVNMHHLTRGELHQ